MTLAMLKITAFLFGHLPLSIPALLGRIFGLLIYRLDKKHRDIAKDNLRRAFGADKSGKEIERITKKVFQNLAAVFFEFMRIPWLTAKKLDNRVRCDGMENLQNALKKGKGVIFITAHFGNWELMAAYYGLKGLPVDIVARELDNPALEEFVKWTRQRSGNRIVSKSRAMRRLLKTLASNGIAGILLDQNVAAAEGVFVDFFGTPACTNKGPAMLAAISGAAIIPTFILREGKKHRIIIGREVERVNTGDKNRDALVNTARMTKVIEDIIRKHPEQWFWVHRRWKTRPPEETKTK
ncbi:MAG: lysophospholipid acyltransferase family protein [Deltaproteobacteria bacterium]|nr:lysophospholipid acyltransferase family protein [Deltaproteobacteria bacterium]